jgi:hypothetical protein
MKYRFLQFVPLTAAVNGSSPGGGTRAARVNRRIHAAPDPGVVRRSINVIRGGGPIGIFGSRGFIHGALAAGERGHRDETQQRYDYSQFHKLPFFKMKNGASR